MRALEEGYKTRDADRLVSTPLRGLSLCTPTVASKTWFPNEFPDNRWPKQQIELSSVEAGGALRDSIRVSPISAKWRRFRFCRLQLLEANETSLEGRRTKIAVIH